jgi:4-hydroxy-3-methylbut-2-enyl diphosphate reductase
VHHVQGTDEVREEWFTSGETVGITAGTSTPDSLINAIEHRLRQLADANRNLASVA